MLSYSFLILSLSVFEVRVIFVQSCPTLCNPMDCRPPGSSVHGISQARILEWVAISFSRGSSWPRDRTWISHIEADTLTSEPPGKPPRWVYKCFLLFSILRNFEKDWHFFFKCLLEFFSETICSWTSLCWKDFIYNFFLSLLSSLVIVLFSFLFLHELVVIGCILLEIYPFLLNYSIC